MRYRLGRTCCSRANQRASLSWVASEWPPTEAFAALREGADGLKMFPAEQLSPAALKAWRAVLPKDALVLPVGGMRPDNLSPWWEAGADGFGTGSNLYKRGASVDDVRRIAQAFAGAIQALPKRA